MSGISILPSQPAENGRRTASVALPVAILLAIATAAIVADHRAVATLANALGGDRVEARPATEVRPLACEALADVPGKSVTTALVTFPPRAYSPAHRHPGAVSAFVVSGSIRSQLAGTPAETYGAGATWFEPAGALHLVAENPSVTQTAQLLAVFITDHNCGPLVIPEAGPVPSDEERNAS